MFSLNIRILDFELKPQIALDGSFPSHSLSNVSSPHANSITTYLFSIIDMGSLIKLSPQSELQYIEIFLGIKNLFNYDDLSIWIFFFFFSL